MTKMKILQALLYTLSYLAFVVGCNYLVFSAINLSFSFSLWYEWTKVAFSIIVTFCLIGVMFPAFEYIQWEIRQYVEYRKRRGEKQK